MTQPWSYEKANRILYIVMPSGLEEAYMTFDIDISLHLNLVACGLKLGNFSKW